MKGFISTETCAKAKRSLTIKPTYQRGWKSAGRALTQLIKVIEGKQANLSHDFTLTEKFRYLKILMDLFSISRIRFKYHNVYSVFFTWKNHLPWLRSKLNCQRWFFLKKNIVEYDVNVHKLCAIQMKDKKRENNLKRISQISKLDQYKGTIPKK